MDPHSNVHVSAITVSAITAGGGGNWDQAQSPARAAGQAAVASAPTSYSSSPKGTSLPQHTTLPACPSKPAADGDVEDLGLSTMRSARAWQQEPAWPQVYSGSEQRTVALFNVPAMAAPPGLTELELPAGPWDSTAGGDPMCTFASPAFSGTTILSGLSTGMVWSPLMSPAPYYAGSPPSSPSSSAPANAKHQRGVRMMALLSGDTDAAPPAAAATVGGDW